MADPKKPPPDEDEEWEIDPEGIAALTEALWRITPKDHGTAVRVPTPPPQRTRRKRG